MPSLVSFLLQNNSNSPSENENNMSDQDDSDNQNDEIHNQRSKFLTRQVVAVDDNWIMKNSRNGNTFPRSSNQGEATLLEIEPDETSFIKQTSSPKKNKSVNMFVDNNQQSDDNHIFSPDELDNAHPISKIHNNENIQSSSSSTTRTNRVKSPIRTATFSKKTENGKSIRSRSPALPKNKRQTSASSSTNKGAFHYFRTPDQQNSPSLKDDRKRISSSDEDSETNNLKENDLKVKLKEEKRHGKKTGELLNKLHENYEELLEKYAQAENTIDQLRFQPRFFDDITPRSTTSEHHIHFTQQSKVNHPTLRSSGLYHSATASPISSIRPVISTTTTTTPARKSISPTNSGTIESVFFNEGITEKLIRQDITTPETLKLDLLIGIKTLGDKMKSFLTLMDENQLSLGEQKQVYENIREDYEKLLKIFDKNHDDIDLNSDINKELEMMKQLLKEIVTKITENLLGKSINDSSLERQTTDESRSSRLSTRSSLCNHNDLMNQYAKLLNAVNTKKKDPKESETTKPINTKQKPYVYISGDSDDEQQQQQQQSTGIAPIPYTKGIQSTSFELDYIPSTSVKHHQHKIEEQSKRKPTHPSRYSNSRTNDYDSGVGTNNLTKLSYDSKLYTNTMDESHFQSLDDEQESISSSSRSSGSGSESPRSPFRKKSHNRRKPSGHSDSFRSNTESHLTGSFDPQPKSSLSKKNMHRSHHTWRPEKSSTSHRSRLTPIYRSTSNLNTPIEDYKIKSYRPLTISKIKTNHREIIPATYRSSIYIDHAHKNNQLQEIKDRKLYLDPQTGIVYRYESNKNEGSIRIYNESSSPKKLYQCAECGTVTTYHHRHHIDSTSRRVINHSDDLGYESDYKKKSRRYRYVEYSSSSSSSSDSDSDVSSSYLDLYALNQAYNRAEKIQQHSRCLSRYIVRQIKVALATI